MPVPEQSCYHGHQELFLSSPPSVFNLSTGGISILIMMTPKLTNILQIQRCSTNADCPAARVGTRVLYNNWCVYRYLKILLQGLVRYSCKATYCVQDQLQWVKTSGGQWIQTGKDTYPWRLHYKQNNLLTCSGIGSGQWVQLNGQWIRV